MYSGRLSVCVVKPSDLMRYSLSVRNIETAAPVDGADANAGDADRTAAATSRLRRAAAVHAQHIHAAEYARHWRGLRVRIGLHYGKGDIAFDEVAKGYDYYGSVVNAASRNGISSMA